MDSNYSHLNRYQRPSNYIGSTWEGYYVFLGRNRDSDDLANSNFDCGLAAVKAVMSKDSIPNDPEESATVQVVSENHWAVGWVEWIAIHESDTAALTEANRIMEKLESYPVLNEDDWSNREMESANRVWKDCYRPTERVEYIRKHRSQFEFRDFQDPIGCVRGRYFSGYASELVN